MCYNLKPVHLAERHVLVYVRVLLARHRLDVVLSLVVGGGGTEVKSSGDGTPPPASALSLLRPQHDLLFLSACVGSRRAGLLRAC